MSRIGGRRLKGSTARLMTAREVGAFLRVSESTLAYWRRHGRGPKVLRLSAIRYGVEDLHRWLETCGSLSSASVRRRRADEKATV